MGKYLLVGFLVHRGEWFARQRGGYFETSLDIRTIMEFARDTRLPVNIDTGMDIELQQRARAAAIFAGIRIVDMNGEIEKSTPVPEATIRYITRAEIGNILPDGWFIECQLNGYAAMFGEEITFPYRKKLELAINDIRGFLAASALSASQDLAKSIAAQTALEEEGKQLLLWSSDSPLADAADVVRRT